MYSDFRYQCSSQLSRQFVIIIAFFADLCQKTILLEFVPFCRSTCSVQITIAPAQEKHVFRFAFLPVT